MRASGAGQALELMRPLLVADKVWRPGEGGQGRRAVEPARALQPRRKGGTAPPFPPKAEGLCALAFARQWGSPMRGRLRDSMLHARGS